MYKSLIILTALLTYNTIANNFSPYFSEKDNVTPSIKALLNNHKQEIKNVFSANTCKEGCIKKSKVYEFPWLPGYLIKKGESRLLGADIIRSVIKQNNLDLLKVPNKKVYLPTQSTENSLVIVPKFIPTLNPKPLSLRQVQQIWTLISKSGYVDLHNSNYLRLPNNTIMIIDTELTFFSSDINRGLSRFILSHKFAQFEEDAFKFIVQEFAKHLKQNYETEESTIIQQKIRQLEGFTPHFSETSTYSQLYGTLEVWLTVQKNIFEWDYKKYFKENYPKPPLVE